MTVAMIALVTSLYAACAGSTRVIYVPSLVEVSLGDQHAIIREGDADKPLVTHSYSVQFGIKENRITLRLENTQDTPLKILWDDSVFVDLRRQSQRAMHWRVEQLDKRALQVPTVIAPRTILMDEIVPENNLRYTGNSWVAEPLISEQGGDAAGSEGRTFRLLLQVESKSGLTYDEFTFEIQDIVKVTKEAPGFTENMNNLFK